MTLEELANMTRKELLDLAKEKQIKNRSKMTKAELIESLRAITVQSENKPDITKPKEEPPEPIYTSGIILDEEKGGKEEAKIEEFTLPPFYNQTKITLLIRDPYWLFTYWDLHYKVKEKLKHDYNGWERIPFALRVYGEEESGSSQPEFFDVTVSPCTNNWYINVKPNHKYAVHLGYFSPSGEFITLACSNTVITPRDGISKVVDEEWMVIEEDFRRLYQLAGGFPTADSVEIIESLVKRLEREMGSAAISSISSPAGIPTEKRHFWLVLDTELIVYGATEPDAHLTVDGQPVVLRPDGSFTLRMALPDGLKIIPVTAQSNDGKDKITITPVVSKETR
jgi:hypothetical protein